MDGVRKMRKMCALICWEAAATVKHNILDVFNGNDAFDLLCLSLHWLAYYQASRISR